jgi:hypothetical protein
MVCGLRHAVQSPAHIQPGKLDQDAHIENASIGATVRGVYQAVGL